MKQLRLGFLSFALVISAFAQNGTEIQITQLSGARPRDCPYDLSATAGTRKIGIPQTAEIGLAAIALDIYDSKETLLGSQNVSIASENQVLAFVTLMDQAGGELAIARPYGSPASKLSGLYAVTRDFIDAFIPELSNPSERYFVVRSATLKAPSGTILGHVCDRDTGPNQLVRF